MVSDPNDAHVDIQQVLSAPGPAKGGRRWRWLVYSMVVLVLGGLAYLWWAPSNGTRLSYQTRVVKRGDITVTVTATGTLEPLNQVDVGSELSGTVEQVLVDYNDQVEAGQVLARLNTDRLQADVVEARASLASKRAKQQEAEATVLETRLAFERCEKLAARQLCSGEELDKTRAESVRARALAASAKAQVAVAQATLEGKETELEKASIQSPINGLVLLRQIEPGQTVAASLQAPVLFTLAEDLTQMALHVAVDEADVGQVAERQRAEFTVDAYPKRRFPASITQVRFAPQTIDGVVTYETLLAVDNSDLVLRPGMTATAVITVQNITDATLLPNAALRFTPPASDDGQGSRRGIFGSLFPRPPMASRRSNQSRDGGQQVWVLKQGEPVAVAVKTGASDGRFTRLLEGELEAGDQVIVDTLGKRR
jgi:HlyD family secretion protein